MDTNTNNTETTTQDTTSTPDNDRWDDTPAEETSEEKETSEEPKKEGTKQPAPKKEKKFRKVVVDGQEEVVDEDQVFRAYQKYRSADREKRELAEARKRLDAFMQKFQEDPVSFLQNSKVPLNRKELAERWLKEEIARSLKDPKDVEIEERDRRLKAFEDKERAEKEAQINEERNRKVEGRRQELSKVFAEAMKQSPLSQDPKHSAEALREMAMYMRIARQNGEEVTPEELASHVENQKLSQFRAVADSLEGEMLLEFFGEKIANKIRKADLARIRKARGEDQEVKQEKSDSWGSSSKTKEKEFLDPISAREAVRKRLGLK